MIGNVAGLGHGEIPVIHRLGEDDRHQAVPVGDLLGVAWLQWCQGRQEMALFIDKAEHVGDIAKRHLLIECSCCAHSLSAFGLRQVELFALAVVFEMFQLSLA